MKWPKLLYTFVNYIEFNQSGSTFQTMYNNVCTVPCGCEHSDSGDTARMFFGKGISMAISGTYINWPNIWY